MILAEGREIEFVFAIMRLSKVVPKKYMNLSVVEVMHGSYTKFDSDTSRLTKTVDLVSRLFPERESYESHRLGRSLGRECKSKSDWGCWC